MKTNVTNDPAKTAGRYITEKIAEHQKKDILLLLSGGSVLQILEYIDASSFGPHVTLALTDDRFTDNIQENNFLQIQNTEFFSKINERGIEVIATNPQAKEDFDAFFNRIEGEYNSYVNTHTNAYVLGIFGIGDDGHTASIFPDDTVSFKNKYRNENILTQTFNGPLPYAQRITITPKFIEEHINEVVLYAVGKNKCQTILQDMYNTNFDEHQIPALIPASHPQSILITDCEEIAP